MYFKEKTTPTIQTQQETEKLLVDLELSDTDMTDTDEMSQDENSLPRIENPKEEAKTPQTTTENKNTLTIRQTLYKKRPKTVKRTSRQPPNPQLQTTRYQKPPQPQ